MTSSSSSWSCLRRVATLGTVGILACSAGAQPVAPSTDALTGAKLRSHHALTTNIQKKGAIAPANPNAPRGGSDGTDACNAGSPISGTGTVATGNAGASNTASDVAAGACGSSQTSVDVWFNYTPTASGSVVFDFCPPCGNATYDTVLEAYTACPSAGGQRLACNDDLCGLQSRITVPVTANVVVKIRVAGFSANVGTGTLTYNSPTMCEPPPPCILTPPSGGVPEGEVCGSDINGGCNSPVPIFGTITCGGTILGSAWATGGTRDTDWFDLALSGPTQITVSGQAQFPLQILILSNVCPTTVLSFVTAARCDIATLTFVVPGSCRIFASNQAFDLNPCGVDNDYWIQVTDCVPLTPPPNDNCANAQLITPGMYAFDTRAATNDGTATCGASATSPDVWYRVVTSANGGCEFKTCDLTTMDTVLSAHSQPCGPEIFCLDDSCGLQTLINVPSTAGVPTWFRVAGFNGQTGMGQVMLTFLPEVCRPVITGFTPQQAGPGEIVTIVGSGFGNNPNNLCIVSMPPGSADVVTLRALTATDTQITAMVGNVGQDDVPGVLMVECGQGNVGTFTPVFRDIIPEMDDGTWVWHPTDHQVAAAPGLFRPIPIPPPPPIRWFTGHVVNGRLCVFIDGNWMPNTKVTITTRARRHSDFFGADLDTTCLRFRGGGDAFHCAIRIADAIRCAFAQDDTPVVVNVNVIPAGPNRFKIEVILKGPNGEPVFIDWGGLDICAFMPRKLILPSGCFVTPFFNATIMHPAGGGDPGPVLVQNIGSSGQDGATIDVAMPATGVVVRIRPIDLDVPMRMVHVSTWGTWNNTPYLFLGESRLWGRPNSCLDANADFTAIQAPNVRIVAVDANGNQVGPTVVRPAGNVGVVQGLPGLPVPFVDCWGKLPPRPPCIFWNFSGDFIFTPINGQPFPPARQLRLLAHDSPGDINLITQIDQALGVGSDGQPVELLINDIEVLGVPVRCCDFNRDGLLNSQDFFDFLVAFFGNLPASDFNGDGVLNSQDFFDFITCFFQPPAGCP